MKLDGIRLDLAVRYVFFSEEAEAVYKTGAWRDFPVKRDAMIWRTHDGFVMCMNDIEDSHLLNIIRFIEGRGQKEIRDRTETPYVHEQCYPLMIEEVQHRGLEFHGEAHPDAIERRMEREDPFRLGHSPDKYCECDECLTRGRGFG